VLKGQTGKAQRLLSKIAKFNCKPNLSVKLKSEREMEANFHQQHFTVSDGEQDNTEGHNGETDNASSASPFLVVASNHQEKAVILYTLSCVTVREREREMDSHRKGVTKYDSV